MLALSPRTRRAVRVIAGLGIFCALSAPLHSAFGQPAGPTNQPPGRVARVDVRISDGTTHPTCTLQAFASDHSVVGQLRFTPNDGTNQVTVRTARTATSVSLPGCIADGQDQPR